LLAYIGGLILDIKFGEFIKDKRNEKGISLRDMAERLDIAPSYLSDIEKGRRYAPDKEKLEEIASILNIDGTEKNYMFDLAGKTKESIAPDLPEIIKEHEKASVLLRKAKEYNLTDEHWDKLIKMIEGKDR
jgi:transcriptional regulator with XRE-family HTH domain